MSCGVIGARIMLGFNVSPAFPDTSNPHFFAYHISFFINIKERF